jgi:hypothetical protein
MDHGEVVIKMSTHIGNKKERDDMVNERSMFFTRKPSLSIELMALHSGLSLRSPNLVEPAAILHQKTTH